MTQQRNTDGLGKGNSGAYRGDSWSEANFGGLAPQISVKESLNEFVLENHTEAESYQINTEPSGDSYAFGGIITVTMVDGSTLTVDEEAAGISFASLTAELSPGPSGLDYDLTNYRNGIVDQPIVEQEKTEFELETLLMDKLSERFPEFTNVTISTVEVDGRYTWSTAAVATHANGDEHNIELSGLEDILLGLDQYSGGLGEYSETNFPIN